MLVGRNICFKFLKRDLKRRWNQFWLFSWTWRFIPNVKRERVWWDFNRWVSQIFDAFLEELDWAAKSKTWVVEIWNDGGWVLVIGKDWKENARLKFKLKYWNLSMNLSNFI